MICPYCNNEIDDKSKVCDICGVEVNIRQTISKKPDALDAGISIVIFFNAFVLVAFGVGIIYGFARIGLTVFKPILGFAILGLGLISYGVSVFLTGLGGITRSDKYEKLIDIFSSIGSYSMTGGFFIFWFGFLIVMDISLLKEGNGTELLLFSLIFWVVGIAALISTFKKK